MDFFKMLWSKVASLFSGSNGAKVASVLKTIGDLARLALPTIEMLSIYTPTMSDDAIVALAKKFLVPNVQDLDPFSKPLTVQTKEDLLFAAARAAFMGELAKAIEQAGTAGIMLGEQRITSMTGIPGNVIDSAVQNAYSIYRATQPKTIAG